MPKKSKATSTRKYRMNKKATPQKKAKKRPLSKMVASNLGQSQSATKARKKRRSEEDILADNLNIKEYEDETYVPDEVHGGRDEFEDEDYFETESSIPHRAQGRRSENIERPVSHRKN